MSASTPNAQSNHPLMAAAWLIPALLAVPFIGKAFHVDDPLFVWTAQHIVEQPLNFYGFKANWERTAVWMYQIQQNPPLLSYYFVPFGLLFGWGELVLHAALLPLIAAAGGGIFLLARQFSAAPWIAWGVAVVSPAFIVSSTQVMSDVPMLTLFVWSLYFWIRGLDSERVVLLVVSGLLIGLGALTKYFAATAVPLLVVLTLMRGPRYFRYLVYLLIPFFMLIAYEFLTYRLYGMGLMADAFSFARDHRAEQQAALGTKFLNTVVFLGGCVLPVLCFLPWMMPWNILRRVLIASAAIVIAFSVMPLYVREWLNTWHPMQITFPLNFEEPGASVYNLDISIWPTYLEMAQWSLFMLTGLLIVALFVADLINRRDRFAVVLFLWCMGTLIFVAVVNHHVNARVILPIVPAVGIVVARRVEDSGRCPAAPWSSLQLWPLAPVLVISMLLAHADFHLAGTARRAANEIMDRPNSGTVWFSGHSGFQYYMQERGAQSIDIYKSMGMPGDTFVQPSNNWYPMLIGPHMVGSHTVLEFDTVSYVTISHFQRYAGFYSDYTGPAPFMFGPVPAEQYLLVEMAVALDVREI